MKQIVKKACGTVWPKIFQNCRSTRQTELSQKFPSHVVASWLGNSTKIAEQYYLQVTEDHFQQALVPEAKPKVDWVDDEGAKQQAQVDKRTRSQKSSENDESANDHVPLSIHAISKAPLAGIEPATPALGKLCSIH